VTLKNGTIKPFTKLSKKEKQELFQKINTGLAEEMSLYYSNNTDDYINLCNRAVKP
jgi:hypothetical protein